MAKSKTPSYILELKLDIQPFQQHKLERFFEAARVVYNTCLSIALKRSNQLKIYQPYLDLLKENSSKKRNDALKQIRLNFGFSEYQLHEVVVSVRNQLKFIGSFEAQALATRAFRTVEKLHYGEANKVHFKRKGEMDSIENKSNATGLREKDGVILWNGLELHYITKKNDAYAQLAHLDRTKFVRIVRRTIRGKIIFFAQLIKEGVPPLKNRSTKDGEVGIDIGTSTVAIVSDEKVSFQPLINNEHTLKKQAQKIRCIQRKMDRSKRVTNPNKFNANGTINRTNKESWNLSNRYKKLLIELQNINRKHRIFRKESHEQLANAIICLGNQVKVEKMSFSGLQKRVKETKINEKTGHYQKKKRFGKSLLNYAPSMLLTIIDRKLNYFGQKLLLVDTYKVRASQFNHFDHSYKKKTLAERWNDFNGIKVHRDLYSAFLIQQVQEDLETIDVKKCTEKFDTFLEKHNILFNL